MGPVLYLDIQKDKFEVCIKGYISILGIGRLINIEITSSSFSFEVSGDLWGVLSMSIKVKADYANKKLNSFSVSLFICYKDYLIYGGRGEGGERGNIYCE